MEQREKDIQEICKQVLNTWVDVDEDRGEIHCPFCGNKSYGDNMEDIKHESNCAYVIAKDLSTGF